MRPSRDVWALQMAKLVSTRATCLRRQVGCVLLNAKGHVLATGYNGRPAGFPHCDHEEVEWYDYKPFGDQSNHEIMRPTKSQIIHPCACNGADAVSGKDLDSCQAIHAEQNAMLQCKNVYEIDTAYITCSPCMTCTKLLLNTSCRRIVYIEEYAHSEWKEMWEQMGRESLCIPVDIISE